MKVLKFLLLATSVFYLTACSLDDENKYETYTLSFGNVSNANTSAGTFLLTLDDGTRLYTKETGEDYVVPPTNGTRVFATYVLLNEVSSDVYDYNMKIKALTTVLIDSILTVDTIIKDSIGNNRWGKVLMYAGADYLNLVSAFYASEGSYTHKFYLVKDTITHNDNKVYLDLLYSNGGDNNGTISAEGVISFDLSSLKAEYPDSVNLVINTYQESPTTPETYPFTYKWKQQ